MTKLGYGIAAITIVAAGANYIISGDYAANKELSQELKADRVALAQSEARQKVENERLKAESAEADNRYRGYCLVVTTPDYKRVLNVVPGETLGAGEFNGKPRLLSEGTTVCDDKGWTGVIAADGTVDPDSMKRSTNAPLYRARAKQSLLDWKPAIGSGSSPTASTSDRFDKSKFAQEP